MKKYHKLVVIWLFIGLVMLVVQVVVGGITRLTGSGLSITKWEIVTGTIPPLNAKEWNEEFDLYKKTPQYREINEGMTLSDFKFIYFWEYIHRFWARIMGFVFLIPFLVFWFKGYFDRMLKIRLIVVFLLAALAASFGWIMVASGLIERPWVNAYKLAIHLSIAFAVYGYLLWTYFKTTQPEVPKIRTPDRNILQRWSIIFLSILCLQIFIGGIMSGMKAGLAFPTWPDMNGSVFPGVIFDLKEWNMENFNYYDRNLFMPALIQTIHRLLAYSLVVIGFIFFVKLRRADVADTLKKGGIVLIIILLLQALLGVLTVINCKGSIPLTYGVLHQGMALMLLTASMYVHYYLKEKN